MAQPDACPACGTPAEPDQDYCLHCGARLVPARQLGDFGHAWQHRLGRYPGDWVFASLLLLLVAAGSATAGIVAGRDTDTASSAQRTIVATSPVVAAPPSPPAQTEPTTAAAKPKPGSKPKPAAKPSKPGLAVWPAKDGYTVVIASIPSRSGGLSQATSKAREALARGLRAGVLDSGKFASLHPGYYVVFAGIYGSLEEAERAARADASKYPNAYAREVAH
jgi:hypothetical protein